MRLADEEVRLAQLSGWKRRATAGNVALGFGRFNVNPSALPLSAEQLLGEMNVRWDRARLAEEQRRARFGGR